MDKSLGDMRTEDKGLRPERTDVSMGNRDTLKPGGATLGRIDQYELQRELGGGGFGVVFLARDTVAGVDVAVKGLPPLVKNNADELERIRENFALVSKLHHPHIAAALHLHPAQNVSYSDERIRQALRVLPGDTLMVMAYAPGVTLSKWRRQFPEGKVPVAQALEVCRQIALALDYAHGERVVHRDVKPSNVVVETRNSKLEAGTPTTGLCVRVLDFGLAAEIRSSMSRVSQEKGDTSGTRPYMAPEQWAGRRQDGRTDQYALAALFYELVSGVVPFASAFDTGDPVIMANAAQNIPPEPLPELTKAQNAALLRALAKDPAQRFAGCGEFTEALGGGKAHAKPRKPGGKTALLCLAAAAALVFGTYLTYTSYRSHSARRAAAEQTAALDAAQREKAEGLKAAAEAALASGDLETAGAKIAELDGLGGTSVGSSDLRKRYEAKAGERETNRRYAAASVAREAAQKLERGQGFGARLDALEVTWREAEAARQGQGWGQALSGYDAVLAACKTLIELEVSRQDAKTQRDAAEKAKTDAAQAEAAKDAKEGFENAGRTFSRAADLFEKGDFTGASKTWQDSSASYDSAKTRASAVQAHAKAKTAFETALGGPAASRAVLLGSHGGPKWADVNRLQTLGAASANDPVAGEKAYQDALAGLPAAVAEAESAERAGAERLAAERKAREERDRQDKLAAVLAAARQAKAAGEWQACVDRAAEALALEAGNAEAAALKREAEGSLTPTLTVAAEAGGRAVAAEISDGQRSYTAPHTFTLKPGERYAFKVSISSNPSIPPSPSTRYKPATLDITADWSGPQTRRVALEEVKGPVAGEPWASPATGMDFVWVPALKLWVGKYEVTNNEYRKKVSDHDSKDYKGLTLNDDHQPVVYVNFDDAKAYAEWLTGQDLERLGGLRYRVVSEAEWQTVAQCGDGREYPWGNAMPPKHGNYSDSASPFEGKIAGYTDGFAVACPVELSGANEWGVYGLGGNVWECCASDASGSAFGAWRGASWGNFRPDPLRCAFRYDYGGSSRNYIYGFRLALSR